MEYPLIMFSVCILFFFIYTITLKLLFVYASGSVESTKYSLLKYLYFFI